MHQLICDVFSFFVARSNQFDSYLRLLTAAMALVLLFPASNRIIESQSMILLF